MPCLDISAVFSATNTEQLVAQLFIWAEEEKEPLKSYATGLLAALMAQKEVAANFRELNAHLAPLTLKRLREIQKRCSEERKKDITGIHF